MAPTINRKFSVVGGACHVRIPYVVAYYLSYRENAAATSLMLQTASVQMPIAFQKMRNFNMTNVNLDVEGCLKLNLSSNNISPFWKQENHLYTWYFPKLNPCKVFQQQNSFCWAFFRAHCLLKIDITKTSCKQKCFYKNMHCNKTQPGGQSTKCIEYKKAYVARTYRQQEYELGNPHPQRCKFELIFSELLF